MHLDDEKQTPLEHQLILEVDQQICQSPLELVKILGFHRVWKLDIVRLLIVQEEKGED